MVHIQQLMGRWHKILTPHISHALQEYQIPNMQNPKESAQTQHKASGLPVCLTN